MTDAELAELERLCEVATPGPWEWEAGMFTGAAGRPYNLQVRVASPWGEGELHPHVLLKTVNGWEPKDSDAAFIAAARTAVPALIAEVRRLRDALESEWYGAPLTDKERAEPPGRIG